MEREAVWEYEGVTALERDYLASGWYQELLEEHATLVCYVRDKDVTSPPVKPRNKYQRDLKGVKVDVYDVLKAFNVTCPALQHLAKKALCAGLRGHKDLEIDLNDILASAQRAIELNKE